MNSNSLEEEEKESAYFYLCFLVSILLPSCSETKKAEETDRERDIWKERYRGGGRKRGTRRDRRVRVQSSYSYSEVILCESTILPHYLFCLSRLPTPLTHTRKTPLINIKVQCQLPWEYTSRISLTLYRGTQD